MPVATQPPQPAVMPPPPQQPMAYPNVPPQPMAYPNMPPQPMAYPGMPPQQAAPYPGMAPQVDAYGQPIPPGAAPMPEAYQQPQPVPEAEPEPVAEPEPEPEPEPEEEVFVADDEDFGDDDFGEDEGLEGEEDDIFTADVDEDGEEGDGEDPAEALSQEELDDMFGEDGEPEPFESLVESDVGSDEEFDNLDDIPDPEPIPEVFTSRDRGSEEDEGSSRRRTLGLIIALVAVVVIFGSIFGGLFFMKDKVISMWPQAEKLYSMVSFGGAALGEGLDIRSVKPDRRTENNIDVLVVSGLVANVSDQTKPVPMIRVSLISADDEEVQFVVVSPPKPEVNAGEALRFRARLEDPAPTGRRLEVTFTEKTE